MKIQTRTNVSNPAVECKCMFKGEKNEKKEEDKFRDIAESPEVLSRYVRARLLPTNTKGLVKVA